MTDITPSHLDTGDAIGVLVGHMHPDSLVSKSYGTSVQGMTLIGHMYNASIKESVLLGGGYLVDNLAWSSIENSATYGVVQKGLVNATITSPNISNSFARNTR